MSVAPVTWGARSDRPTPMRWFAVAAPGLQDVVCAECERLSDVGVSDLKVTPGGVEFSGSLQAGLAANLRLRVATRVLLRLGTVRAREFAILRRALDKMPWKDYAPVGVPLKISVAASRCRLYHTGAISDQVVQAVQGRAGKRELLPAEVCDGDDDGDETPAVTRILLRGDRDVFTVSVDASGELLHRRGDRVDIGRAPLRETLAAGVLALCEYDPKQTLVDGMCGAGTFVLEAGSIAEGRAPGQNRSFACERWTNLTEIRKHILASGVKAAGAIFACDRDPGALVITRRNLVRAQLENRVTVVETELGHWRPPGEPGLVVANPPYGRRLALSGTPERFFRDLGRGLRTQFGGWRAGIIVPQARFAQALGLPIERSHRLVNGGLKIDVVICRVPTGR